MKTKMENEYGNWGSIVVILFFSTTTVIITITTNYSYCYYYIGNKQGGVCGCCGVWLLG